MTCVATTALQTIGAGTRGAHSTATSHAMPRIASARVRSAWSIGGLSGSAGSRCARGPTIQPGNPRWAGPERNEGRSAATSTMATARPTIAPIAAVPSAGTAARAGTRGPASSRAPRQARHFQGDVRARARHAGQGAAAAMSRGPQHAIGVACALMLASC